MIRALSIFSASLVTLAAIVISLHQPAAASSSWQLEVTNESTNCAHVIVVEHPSMPSLMNSGELKPGQSKSFRHILALRDMVKVEVGVVSGDDHAFGYKICNGRTVAHLQFAVKENDTHLYIRGGPAGHAGVPFSIGK